MKKIVFIKNTKTDGVVRLGVHDSESEVTETLTVSYIQSPALRTLCVGDELSDYDFFEVSGSDAEYRARKYALSSLALSDKNERTLKTKLLSRGFDREIAERVCRQMVELGYIDEHRQLERLVLADAAKFYGPSKIIMHLSSRGYRTSDVREVMRDLVERGEIDFAERARTLIEEKYHGELSHEEKKKILYSHGYNIC